MENDEKKVTPQETSQTANPDAKVVKKSKKFDRRSKHKKRIENKPIKTKEQIEQYQKLELKSEKFEKYYKAQLQQYFKDDKEFELFIQKMREKLPSVFRINTANPFWREFQSKLISGEYTKKYFQNEEVPFQIKIKNLTGLDQFKNLVFQMDVSRQELKKKENYKKFHQFIIGSCAAGLISRQEAVSMIPPMLLNVRPPALVFDMCAAPGSKTAQFLEIAYKDYDYFDKNSVNKDIGAVIANDNNVDRAFLMSHQVKRLNTAGMCIFSHDGQNFPTIHNNNDDKILFDNILCDVPCSSDAVMRKLPHKWKTWSTKESFGLHKLQLILIRRGVAMLKEGGTIIYSTCSLSPIENEAVVTQLMREFEGEIEIVDVSKSFEGGDVRVRPGLTQWKVLVEDKKNDKELVEVKSKEDPLLKEYRNLIEDSCFPESQKIMEQLFFLQNCVRIFPHDSDTSGFFIAVMRKKKFYEAKGSSQVSAVIAKQDKGYEFVDEETRLWLKDYYGLTEDFPINQLVTQSKKEKKIKYISRGVYNFLMADKRNNLNFINTGVKIFELNKLKNMKNVDFHCKYRVCQDSVMYLLPFMKKRVFFCTSEFFSFLIKKVDVKHSEINDEFLRNELGKVKSGCVIIINCKRSIDDYKLIEKEEAYLKFLRENFLDAVCCYTSAVRLSTMLNEDHQHVFNLKYNIDK